MKLLRLSTLFVCLGAALQASEYKVVYSVTSATPTLTLQQPSSGSVLVRFKGISIGCEAAAVIQIERNGSAATATSDQTLLAGANENITGSNAKVRVFKASDSTGGTVTYKDKLNAAGTYSFAPASLQNMFLRGDGTTKNYTFRVTPASSTTCYFNLTVEE